MDKDVPAGAAVLTCRHSGCNNAKQPIDIPFDLVAGYFVFIQQRPIRAGRSA